MALLAEAERRSGNTERALELTRQIPAGDRAAPEAGYYASMALLDLMHRVAPALGLELVLAHVDHGIGPDSGEVAGALGRVAARFAVPMHRVHLSLGPSTSWPRPGAVTSSSKKS